MGRRKTFLGANCQTESNLDYELNYVPLSNWVGCSSLKYLKNHDFVDRTEILYGPDLIRGILQGKNNLVD